MRAVQIVDTSGPAAGLKMAEVPEPEPSHFLTPGEGVVIDVHATTAGYAELMQSRGEHQPAIPPPFVPGMEVAGVVRSAPATADVQPGDPVVALPVLGGFAEVAVAPAHLTFALPRGLAMHEGASLIVNYHTAYFALTTRGRLQEGETVLVRGAGGGVGTAAVQVATALGARVIAVVSSDEKAAAAQSAGADVVLRTTDSWIGEARESSHGGVDMIVDPVAGPGFTEATTVLREGGRVMVLGVAGGPPSEIGFDRLVLTNMGLIGAGWGPWVLPKPDVSRAIGAAIGDLVERGAVRPIVGARMPLEQAATALELVAGRRATGKIVLDVRR